MTLSPSNSTFDDFEEVQIAPGIYLTKRITNNLAKPQTPAPDPVDATQTAQLLLGNSSLEEQLDFLESEKARLENSVRHLLKTNEELRQADPDDPDFVQAIKENVVVLDKQMKLIRKYDEKISQLVPHARAAMPAQPSLQSMNAVQESAHETSTSIQEEDVEMVADVSYIPDQADHDNANGIYL